MQARFCMHCATKLTVVRERGVRKCRRCGWTYWNNPKPTANVVLVKGRRVLLAKRAQSPARGYWSFVGGFVEPGETAEQTVKREAREELGVDIKLGSLLGTFPATYGRGGVAILSICYVGRIAGSASRLKAYDDVASVAWVPMDELPKRITRPTLRALRRLSRMMRLTPQPIWGERR